MNHPSGIITTDYERSEIYPPNNVQIESTAWRVRDHDRYRTRAPFRSYAIFLFILLLAVFGTYGVVLLVAE